MEFVFTYIWTPIAIFILGYILLRFMGKKAVSEMTAFDLLAVLILGTAIAEPIATNRLGIASYYSVAVVLLYIAFSYTRLKNPFKHALSPSPTVLVRGGDVDKNGLKKTKMTTQELMAQLREKGHARPADVEMATMEETGKLSVIPKSDKRPMQPSDIQLSPKPTFIPIPLVMDGEIIDHNLKYLGRDRQWLFKQLRAYGMTEEHLSSVTTAVFNQQGTVEVDTDNKKDHDKGSYNYKPGDTN